MDRVAVAKELMGIARELTAGVVIRKGRDYVYEFTVDDRLGRYFSDVKAVGFDGRSWYWSDTNGMKNAYSDERRFIYSLAQELMSQDRAMKVMSLIKEAILDDEGGLQKVAAEDDPMAGEKLTSLYTKFHTWATKEGTSKPPGSPVASQIIEGMTAVGDALHGKMHLTGRAAVQALLDAMKQDFTEYAAPIPSLARKYGQQTINLMFRGW